MKSGGWGADNKWFCTGFGRRTAWLLASMACVGVAVGGPVANAVTTDDVQSIKNYTAWYDPNFCGSSAATTTTIATTVTTNQNQSDNVKTILGIAKTEGLDQQAGTVALMVAIDESSLQNLANSNVPVSLTYPGKQGVGNDHDSVGIFQQRPSTGWSTIADGDAADSNQQAVFQIMTPAYSAEAFFGGGTGSPGALSKGLRNITNWQTMAPWVAAQTVQGSAFSDGLNYKRFYSQAQTLVSQNWASAAPVPLPVPLTGGTSNTGTGATASNSSACSTVAGGQSNVNCTNGSTPTTVRAKVVCEAKSELALWQGGKMTPGFRANDPTSYSKYTQNNEEDWCADFASWIYNQAGYPLQTGSTWRVPAVVTIMGIGQAGGKFTWHAAGSYTPLPGDLIIHFQGGEEHVNIVVAVNGNTMDVIGGNQHGGGGADLNVVSQYTDRSFVSGDNITGYVSPSTQT